MAYRERGFRRVKMRLGRDPDYDVEALRAVRRAVGKDGDVLVDGSHRYSLAAAEWLGAILCEHQVFWFEEPFTPEDLDSYVVLRLCLSVPLAAGENEFGLQGFRLIRAKALDIVQPDVCRVGGVTEWLRVAALAREANLKVAPHTWSDAVSLMANAHLVAATANAITVEVDQTGNPFIEELLDAAARHRGWAPSAARWTRARYRAQRGDARSVPRASWRAHATRALLRHDVRVELLDSCSRLRLRMSHLTSKK